MDFAADLLEDALPHLRALVLCSVAWTSYHGLLSLVMPPVNGSKHAAANKAVSFTHAVLGAVLGLYSARTEGVPFGGDATPSQLRLIYFMTGYFMYDTMVAVNNRNWDHVFHHATGICGNALVLLWNISAAEVIACYAVTEISTPIMHLRWFAIPLKDRTDLPFNVYEALSGLFAVTFLVCRLLVGPWVTYYTLVSPRTPLAIKVGATFMQGVSCYWAAFILRLLTKALGLGGKREAKDKGRRGEGEKKHE